MVSVLDEPGVHVARFTVERYHRLIEAGVLTDTDRLELLEGILVDKMTEGPSHASMVSLLARMLTLELGGAHWLVRAQHPITTGDSEPEPDLAIVRLGRYGESHPTAADIAAVIEVSDSSLMRDRSTKGRVYAAAGITRCVIVNLGGGAVEVYSNPVSDPVPRYASAVTLTTGAVDLGPISVDAAQILAP